MDNEWEKPSEKLLESSRFWIQRVIVPIMVFIGIGGNIITVMVLTRRRMRCSTNVYLTALSVADVMYLLSVFVLSFCHHANIHDKEYELYWRFFGMTHWLCDSANNSSIWLTVSFTLERYIAVCFPIKGKILCTENRAKSTIVIVAILCILTSATTTFEYELTMNETCTKNCTVEELRQMYHHSHRIHDGNVLGNNVPNMTTTVNASGSEERSQFQDGSPFDEDGYLTFWMTDVCCEKDYSVNTAPSKLAKNQTYKDVMYWYTVLFFWLLPLVMIATFNSFLILTVYKSQRRRRKMTNEENISMSNENRITVMLIGVVILFLICQTPSAVFLLYDNYATAEDAATRNIKLNMMEVFMFHVTSLMLGNIFNLLITINAACNFLLYCVLSKDYRDTFKSLFRDRKKKRRETNLISATRRNPQRNHNATATKQDEANHTSRNLETQTSTSIPLSQSSMMGLPGKAKSTDLVV